jgi:hypothetical protein
MDMSFSRRGRRKLAARSAGQLEFDLLVETLGALQSSSPTAQAEGRCAETLLPPGSSGPLVDLLLGDPEWRQAVAAQGGCFNPAQAEDPRKPK